tara:strand:- start:1080 stop:1730 length:651 start_codon:yes stop_codon:yes gene_type:complete
MDNFKQLIKEALTPDFLKESVNEEYIDSRDEDQIKMVMDKTDWYDKDVRGALGVINKFGIIPYNQYEFDELGFTEENYFDLLTLVLDDEQKQSKDYQNLLLKFGNRMIDEDDDLFDDSGIGGMEFIPDEDDMVDLSNSSSLIGRMGDRTWDETEEKTPVLVDVWYSYHEEHGYGGVYKVKVHFDDESVETFDRLKDAEAKYDLEGVEREETEFDVS